MSKPKKNAAKDVQFPANDAVFKAAFDMVAVKGLGKTRLSALAAQLKVPLDVFYTRFPTLETLLFSFCDAVDEHMLAQLNAGDMDTKRELYFDIIMARLDMFQKYRPGVKRWLEELPKHPTLWKGAVCRFDQSLSLMLDIAKDSPLFPVKKLGLAAIYAIAVRAWAADDAPDMAKTMAALDGALGRGETIIQRFMTPRAANKPQAA